MKYKPKIKKMHKLNIKILIINKSFLIFLNKANIIIINYLMIKQLKNLKLLYIFA